MNNVKVIIKEYGDLDCEVLNDIVDTMGKPYFSDTESYEGVATDIELSQDMINELGDTMQVLQALQEFDTITFGNSYTGNEGLYNQYIEDKGTLVESTGLDKDELLKILIINYEHEGRILVVFRDDPDTSYTYYID